MLLIILMLKAIVEVALFAFIGQGILYIVAGAGRDTNFVFTLLKMITAPITFLVRFISPRIILDRNIPLATFLLLCTIWATLVLAKVQMLLQTR